MGHIEEIATAAGPIPVRRLVTDATLPTIVLAHGAGAGMEHPWMVSMQRALVDEGFPTITFDYAYKAQGRKAPDRLPKLVAVHAAVATWAADDASSVLLAGKSMGGRVGGHVVAEGLFDPEGLVYFGYPLVAMGKTEPRDTSHLEGLRVPQLFVTGTRDRMGPGDLVAELADRVPSGRFEPIESGDHSFKPLVATGRTVDDSIRTAAALVAAWWSAYAPGGV